MITRDSKLVRRIRRGDAEAFEELVHKYQSPLLGFVTCMCSDPAAAEDVVQDLFLKLLRGLPGYRERGKLRSFLFTLARNATLDILRRRPTVSFEESCPALEPVAGENPHHTAERADSCRRLQAAIALLPEPQREVILMHHFGGLTYADISRVTGIPLGTALARGHHGQRKLKSLLESRIEG